MEEEGLDTYNYFDEPSAQNVVVRKLGENIYDMSVAEEIKVGSYSMQDIGKYNTRFKKIAYSGQALSAEFEAMLQQAITAGQGSFEFEETLYIIKTISKMECEILAAGGAAMKYASTDMGEEFAALVGQSIMEDADSFEFEGENYSISAPDGGKYQISRLGNFRTAYISSTFVFDTVEPGLKLSDEFKLQALLAIYGDGAFEADGKSYSVKNDDEEMSVYDEEGNQFAAISTFVVRRYNGEDSLSLEFKSRVREVVMEMEEQRLQTSHFSYSIAQLDENGLPVLDENGKEVLVESDLVVNNKVTTYVVVCEQYTYMLDRFAAPSQAHPFGTDGDGMDILARMMAGGRVSLLVGFVVVILEIILGVIMGGIAGYFGGWVDNLVMRLVDIFYCIPSMPILIILGSMLDAMRVEPYVRLMWLMAILGFLGWASIARLVRGQILSLREQDFMVATEATGLPVRRRIFRHLIPNVMPQLIVTATMGLGSVILTESTLSFLGLGVKHPMATWGTMINSVATSAQAMTEYTYIWIPVGCLICLTVIAFNFVGDGLRDAFDPKMKR
ncbi:MAG: ABC transporter permease [Oscillospiraceae bacterium]|nr:ABC transporter permease [Oscillospiraceae bacterium]